MYTYHSVMYVLEVVVDCVSQTLLPDQEGPSAGSMSTFELMSSKDLAYQMTMFDWELFSCVHEVSQTNSLRSCSLECVYALPWWLLSPPRRQHELLYHTFGRQSFRRTTANLDLFLRRFNQVQLWVVTEVCLCGQLSKRVQLLKKFIKIAAQWVESHAFKYAGWYKIKSRACYWFRLPYILRVCVFFWSCREFKNLNSFFAIIMGMSNPAVSRLSQTWEVNKHVEAFRWC